MTKSQTAIPLLAAALFLGGCAATNSGTPCDGWRAIRPTTADVTAMSDGTVAQILMHNEHGAKVCGWAP